MPDSARLLRHVVLFGFKDDASEEAIAECVRRFALLPQLIPSVKEFEWGSNVSPEDKANGHTHCFQMAFASEADRDAYLVHPDHVAFVHALQSNLERSTVLDYWVASGE